MRAVIVLVACAACIPETKSPAQAPETREQQSERECASGTARACYLAGARLVDARADVQRGIALIEKACALKDDLACSNAAVGFESGSLGFPKDEARAQRMRRLACVAGHDDTCRKEIARTSDLAIIERLATDLVCRKPTYPCENLVGIELVTDGRNATDHALARTMFLRARVLFEQACAKNQALGCRDYALLSLDEAAGPIDAQAVAKVLEAPCTTSGEEEVCFGRGRALLKLGMDAKPAFVRPCANGSPLRCEVEEGRAYAAEGKWESAAAIFERECRAGNAKVCVESGNVAMARKNKALARTAFRTACEANVAAGCTRLGALELEGADAAKAHAHFEHACALGDAEACRLVQKPEIGKAAAASAAFIGQLFIDLFLRWPLEGTIKVLDVVAP